MLKESKVHPHAHFPATALICILLCLLTYPKAAPQDRRPSSKSPKNASGPPDPFLDPASGPLSLSKLLDLLQRIKEDIETEGRVLRAITFRGVDFPITPDNEEQIKAAGGSLRLVDVLREKAPQPPQPAKRQEPKASLSLKCQPAECEVSIEGGQHTSTKNGTAIIPDVKLGDVVVDFRKTGYVSQQRTVTIKLEPTGPIIVELKPDDSTQMEFGSRLFNAMLDALGGEASVHKDLASFSATGSATSFDADGSTTVWNLMVVFHLNKATLDARSSAGSLKLECLGETCQVQSGGRLLGKRLKPEQAQKLETNLRQFRTQHFSAILDRMISTKIRLTAKTGEAAASGEQHLRVECHGEAYDVLLDAQLLPAVVTFESKSGLGSGLRIGFANYATLGASRYPRTTEITLPDGKQGTRVQLDQLNDQPVAR